MPTKVLKKSLTVEIKLDQPIIKSDYHGSLGSTPISQCRSAGKRADNKRSETTVGLDNGERTQLIYNNLTKQKSRLTENCPLRNRPPVGQGTGTYEYDNRFFKYEGQWKNGKKHGQGKLTFTDGSYYEGSFKSGEIEGFGNRFYASTGCKYQGQFVKGEMHGKGRMSWPDGSIYEGTWSNNKRHGYGVIKSVKENSIYKGLYVDNKRQGQGTMIYPQGDRYDGHWMDNMRHGEGDMRFVDGTVYEGQFENDTFQGEGVMRHCSGLVYDGTWINGIPTILPTKLVIVNSSGTQPVEVIQGEPFSITVHCVTDQGDIVTVDSRRELRILAGFKHIKAKKGTALFDLIEEYEEKPMQTPYYEVLQYPLTDFVPEEAAEEDEVREDIVTEMEEEKIKSDDEENPSEQKSITEEAGEGTGAEGTGDATGDPPADPSVPADGSNPVPPGPGGDGTVAEGQGPEGEIATENTRMSEATPGPSLTEKETHPLPPPVANRRSERGVCEWSNIQLAQAPPRFPPFVALEEEEKKLKARQQKQVEAKRLNRQAHDERYARVGEYVIMVQDVTNPPFMGQTLEPAFMTIKLKKKPKKVVKKKEPKPKWDTSKHIESGMMRS